MLNWVGVPGKELAKHQLSDIVFASNHFQLQQHSDAEHPSIRCRDTETTEGVAFRDNLLYHEPPDAKCVELKERQLTLAGWLDEAKDSGNRLQKAEFAAPNRTVGTYHETLGKEATLEAFLLEACKQSKRNWRREYTAKAVIEYIRDGFR